MSLAHLDQQKTKKQISAIWTVKLNLLLHSAPFIWFLWCMNTLWMVMHLLHICKRWRWFSNLISSSLSLSAISCCIFSQHDVIDVTILIQNCKISVKSILVHSNQMDLLTYILFLASFISRHTSTTHFDRSQNDFKIQWWKNVAYLHCIITLLKFSFNNNVEIFGKGTFCWKFSRRK